MIREELHRLKTQPRDLRKFGFSVGGVLLALALLGWWRHKFYWPGFMVCGASLILLGAIVPRCLRAVYIGWMAVAFVIGHIVSTVLLTVFFYVVMTPVGLFARCMGKDFLNRKRLPGAQTCWLSRDSALSKTKADYERQF